MTILILILCKIGWEIVILFKNKRKIAAMYQRKDRNTIRVPTKINKKGTEAVKLPLT